MRRLRRGVSTAGKVVLATALVLVVDACALHTGTVVERSPVQVLTAPPVLPAALPAPDRPLVPSSGPLPQTATALPEPIVIPLDGYADEPVVHYGSIEIPKIGLVHELFEGVTLHNIDEGPSHWTGTATPGSPGNAVFAGHRVTHSHPFRWINELEPGDQILFHVNGQKTVYTVVTSMVVGPEDTWIANQTSEKVATLYACHPPGSAAQRYVVQARFTSAAPDS